MEGKSEKEKGKKYGKEKSGTKGLNKRREKKLGKEETTGKKV